MPRFPLYRRNGRDVNLSALESGTHQFQEYTYKKITPCDVCSQILRGKSRELLIFLLHLHSFPIWLDI